MTQLMILINEEIIINEMQSIIIISDIDEASNDVIWNDKASVYY